MNFGNILGVLRMKRFYGILIILTIHCNVPVTNKEPCIKFVQRIKYIPWNNKELKKIQIS